MQTTETNKLPGAAPQFCPTLRMLYSGSAGVVELPCRVLHPGALQLGREVGEAPGIGLPADGRASRIRATVRTDAAGQRVQLLDADSKNGSFVNGQRVKESQLEDGDVVRVGNSLLLLRYEPARQVDAVVPRLLGSSPAIQAVRDTIAQAAKSGATVLLRGESGTGLVRLLQEHKGHISRVALAIGRSRRQVDRLLVQHGLLRKDFLD